MGIEQKRTPCLQGGRGVDTSEHIRKSPLLHLLYNVFICMVLLSYFVVFGDNFPYCFIKHLLLLFSCLSNVLFSFFIELLIGYFKTLSSKMEEESTHFDIACEIMRVVTMFELLDKSPFIELWQQFLRPPAIYFFWH